MTDDVMTAERIESILKDTREGGRNIGEYTMAEVCSMAEELKARRLEESDEPVDAMWAEENGFTWSSDGTAMCREVTGFEILLSGDLAECEKLRSLSLLSPASYVGGIKCQAHACLCDEPTVGHVLRLIASLSGE